MCHKELVDCWGAGASLNLLQKKKGWVLPEDGCFPRTGCGWQIESYCPEEGTGTWRHALLLGLYSEGGYTALISTFFAAVTIRREELGLPLSRTASPCRDFHVSHPLPPVLNTRAGEDPGQVGVGCPHPPPPQGSTASSHLPWQVPASFLMQELGLERELCRRRVLGGGTSGSAPSRSRTQDEVSFYSSTTGTLLTA